MLLMAAIAVYSAAQPARLAAEDSTRPAVEEKNPHLWQPKTRSVAVFKNGLGFFMREGSVELRDGWCNAKHIPPAAFGTLAIYAHDEKETVDIVGSGPGEIIEFDDRDASSDAKAKRARLESSVNLKVQLTYKYKGQDRVAAGKLVSVGPQFAVLDSGSNSFAVPVDGVTKMQVLELPLRIHVDRDTAEASESKTTKLGMAYLRKGITWIPEYTLKVIDEDTAELTLRGTLVNEAEDLIHTDVHLVVGVPHFVHTQYMAPVAIGQVIRTIGSAVAPRAAMTQLTNNAAIFSNSNGSVGAQPDVISQPVNPAGGNLSSAMGNLPQMANASATDYTVYTKKDLTVRRGEKAIITLFTKKIKYSHIYRWTLPGKMKHLLVLHNSTDTAWTTGPCLALSEERPLSEDLLNYTPKGSNCEFPVTAAINIGHVKSERETDRKLKAHSPTHNVYLDLVTLEGTLKLRNYEQRAVEIIVTNPVPGKPIEAGDEGQISADSTKLELLKRAGTIRWTVKLEPGEVKTLTYSYERYVKSH